jgi:hypothetical protein
MYRRLNLNLGVLKRSNRSLKKSLSDGQHFTRNELQVALRRDGITASGLRLAYILMAAELDGLICSGPRRGKQFTYALLKKRAPKARALGRDEALAELARRYFQSRGPATVSDFAKWSGLTVGDAQSSLESVHARFEHETLGRQTYWFPASRSSEKKALVTAHLLSIYDEYVSSYKDRTAFCTAEIADRLKALGNELTSIMVVNGQIVGTWKRTLNKKTLVIKTNPFRQLTKTENRAVSSAIQQHGEFFGLPVTTG